MKQYVLTTPGLSKRDALFLSSMLDEAVNPMADAVSCSCVDEANDLWAVEAYYDKKLEGADLENLLADTSTTPAQLSIKPVEQRNWVEESLKGLSPVRAGRFFVHGAHDRNQRPKTTINLEIDAGTAFGTGHHGTTKGCLLALDYLSKFNTISNILDVGCGTGVLALAAAKLLKKPVLASDIDVEAVKVTRANARLNGLAPFITTFPAIGINHLKIGQNAPFDLIFANILAGPLVELAPQISQIVSSHGHVVLSGLTTDQERWVLAAWRAQGLVPVKKFRQNNWSTLVLHSGTRNAKKPKQQKPTPVKSDLHQYMITRWLYRRFNSQ